MSDLSLPICRKCSEDMLRCRCELAWGGPSDFATGEEARELHKKRKLEELLQSIDLRIFK